MAKNIFMWLLIILLLITGTLLSLELLGKDDFRPSLKFGTNKSQDITEIKQKLQNIEDKLKTIEANQESTKIGSNTKDATLNSVANTLDAIQNNINQPLNLGTQSGTSSNLIQQREFEACISGGGKDEKGVIATLKSNLCVALGENYRPNSFDLDQEVLTYLETIPATSGSKLNNTQNEVFIFNGGSDLFTPNTSKVGDKFKVTAKVNNNAGVYTFVTISKVEKVI